MNEPFKEKRKVKRLNLTPEAKEGLLKIIRNLSRQDRIDIYIEVKKGL